MLITGASGFVGSKVNKLLSNDYEVLGTYYNNPQEGLTYLDITNSDEVKAIMDTFQPNLIFHAASMIGLEKCEKSKQEARETIVDGTKNLVNIAQESNSDIIYTSTVYVFNGTKGDYAEENQPNPSNLYGQLKLEAESEVLKLNKSIVMRFDMPYGFNGLGQPNGIMSQFLEPNNISLFQGDQMRSPIWLDDIAYITKQLIDKNAEGIFHIATERLSKRELFQDLEKLVRRESLIQESKENINRPNNTTINIAKIRKLGIHLHTYQESLNKIKKRLVN